MSSKRRPISDRDWERDDNQPLADAALRPVTDSDTPFLSPVHLMQAELRRLEHNASTLDQVLDAKAPGWARLTLPIVASSLLWFGIFRVWSLLA